jgi:hypothetical protein
MSGRVEYGSAGAGSIPAEAVVAAKNKAPAPASAARERCFSLRDDMVCLLLRFALAAMTVTGRKAANCPSLNNIKSHTIMIPSTRGMESKTVTNDARARDAYFPLSASLRPPTAF